MPKPYPEEFRRTLLDLVAAGRLPAQELRAIYRCRDRDQASARLYDWTVTCIDSHVPELRRLARTLTTWRAEFLAYFSTGRISNGPTEAVKPPDQENPARRPRIPKLPQLPAAPTTALRNHLATSHPDTTTRPPTTLGCVEPVKDLAIHPPLQCRCQTRCPAKGVCQT